MLQTPLPTKNKNADGLRGLAALLVAIHHFVMAFIPAVMHNNYPTSFSKSAAPHFFTTLFSSPLLTLFYNGSFAVMVFFVLSGYVLAMPYFQPSHSTTILHRRLWGRYLRLNIPIAASVLLSFFVYQCHGYFNSPAAIVSGSEKWLANFFPSGFSFSVAFNDMLWGALIQGNAHFNPVYWTLKAEFLGSLYLLLFYIVKPKKWIIPLLILLMILLNILDRGTSNPIFFYTILLGSLLTIFSLSRSFFIPLFFIGLFFGAYQNGNAVYASLPHFFKWNPQYFYGGIGALLVTAPIIWGFGARFFESRPLQFLGKISFPLYLLHFIVLCSFSCWFYLALPQNALSLTLNFVLYLAISIGISIIFEKYIDQPAIRLTHWITSSLFKK